MGASDGDGLPLMVDSIETTSPQKPIRIGVLGAAGQLGSCLVREIEASDDADLVFATTRDDFDFANPVDLDQWLDARLKGKQTRPLDVVINAAAHTGVDACESEVELAYQINALTPAEWARVLAERDIRLIHVSTNYVFSGDVEHAYHEDDPTEPRTVYGKSKRAGEIAVLGTHENALVVRTSWVFGPGRNFVGAILEQAEARRLGNTEGPLRVVNDQVGSPTSARDLAAALVEICFHPNDATRKATGLLHLRNAEETTWFGFAQKILELGGYGELEIEPVSSSAFKTAAPRPAYSVLDCSKARDLGIEFRSWWEALASYLDERSEHGVQR